MVPERHFEYAFDVLFQMIDEKKPPEEILGRLDFTRFLINSAVIILRL